MGKEGKEEERIKEWKERKEDREVAEGKGKGTPEETAEREGTEKKEAERERNIRGGGGGTIICTNECWHLRTVRKVDIIPGELVW